MKKIIFLNKLRRERKLQIIEPSEEIKESYFGKSESNLASSKILLDNDKLEEAITLTYYGMYNMLIALFFKIGIKCENHTASIILLKYLFEIDNLSFEYAKKERIDKQYYTDFEIAKEEIIKAIEEAEEFNNNLFDFISKITNEDVERYRKKFDELIGKKEGGEETDSEEEKEMNY